MIDREISVKMVELSEHPNLMMLIKGLLDVKRHSSDM